MAYTIYSYPKAHRAFKAVIAGKYSGVQVNYPPFNFGVDNKTPEFLAKNPNGKVPTLDGPDGPVWESNAIARYISRLGKARLYGGNIYESALVDQWIDWSAWELELPLGAWLYPILGIVPFNAEATQKAKGDVRKSLGILNDHLHSRTFLVGERVSLADIVVSMCLLNAYQMVLDPGFRKQFHNTNRWFLTMVHQPEVKAVVGDVHLCEKMQVAKEPAPPVEGAAGAAKDEKKEGGGGGGGGGKKKGEQKPKKEEKPKKEPKAKKEADEEGGHGGHGGEGDDDDEHDERHEKKEKNPLDLLPPSSFVLDDWKRTYSNNDTKTVALPWLWEHWDPKGWSIWHCKHKYDSELEMAFKASNKVTGMLQRLDPLRKYGFGTVLIFGKEPEPMHISGLFVVRGLEIPPELRTSDDFELFDWTHKDPAKPDEKALIEEYLHWEFPAGKPTDGKIFR